MENSIQALYFNDEQANRMLETLSAIDEEYYSDQMGWQDMIRCHLYILLMKASRKADPGFDATPASRSLFLTRRFKGLLEKYNAGDPLVRKYLAHHFSLPAEGPAAMKLYPFNYRNLLQPLSVEETKTSMIGAKPVFAGTGPASKGGGNRDQHDPGFDSDIPF